jgi:hypothetical protein
MSAATDAAALRRLRARVDRLAQRRLAALERLAVLPESPSRSRLEAMRFELAEVEWKLTELERIGPS